jgi:cold shock CspA family protein
MRGKIKFFNQIKNYGFISTKRLDKDLYFNIHSYPKEYMPHETHIVEFRIVENDRGTEATDIQVLRYDE